MSTYGSTIPLSETTKFIVDNRGKTAPTAETGIALIATNCIANDHLYPQYLNVRRVSQETYDTWFRSHPEPGDIILTNKGSQNGAICLVPDPVDFVIAQDMVALRANEEVIDPLFLFAALRSPMVQWQIKTLDVSGIIPHFKKTDFDKLHLPYPDMKTQEAIGRIYFDFCAKIELNRRMNETLEGLARAIFQSWFVDFDPVRAQRDGLPPPALSPATAALFPDSFEDSGLGKIPKGWKTATVTELADINSWTLSRNDALDRIDYVEISEVVRGNVANVQTYSRGEEPSRARRRLRHGDTVLSTVRPDRGSYFLCLNPPSTLIASTGFAVVSPTNAPWAFIHAALTRDDVSQHLGQHADGGAYPAVRPEVIGNLLVPWPNERLIADEFHQRCEPLFQKADENRRESLKLAAIRDALLPKLLSGEIRVAEAERLVEDAG